MTSLLAASWRLGSVDGLPETAPPPAPRIDAPRPSDSRRGKWRRPLLLASAVIHGLILLALMLQPPEKPPEDGVGPPSVSVILGPTANTATSEAPTPQAATGTPDAATAQSSAAPDMSLGEQAPEETAAAEPPQPPTPAAPAAEAAAAPSPPLTAALAPPVPTSAPSVAPPVQAPPATVADETAPPIPLIPPALIPSPPAPAPRTQEALLQPLLRPVPLPRAAQPERQAARPPQPRPAIARSPSPRRQGNPDGFPMPMFSSLGGSFTSSNHVSRTPSREMPGPVQISSSNAFRPQYELSGDNLGSGWERQLREWIERHKYYPREAVENGEEGVAAVTLVIGKDGHVRSVTLVQRSGSQWLDLGLQAMFRGQNLPSIPDNLNESEATINLQMHYILIR